MTKSPCLYLFSSQFAGEDEATRTKNALLMLEEQVRVCES